MGDFLTKNTWFKVKLAKGRKKRQESRKKAVLKRKVEIYESVLHDLHFASTVEMNHERVMDILRRISRWSLAHRACEYSEEEQERLVLLALENLAAEPKKEVDTAESV